MKATARKAFYHGFTGIDKFQVDNSSFLFQTFCGSIKVEANSKTR